MKKNVCYQLWATWRRQWHPTPVLLPGQSHRRRSLVGCVQSMGSLRGLSNFTFTFLFHALEKERATHSSILAWRIPGREEPGGLPSMGSHRVGHDWSEWLSSSSMSYLWLKIGHLEEMDFMLNFSEELVKKTKTGKCGR